jgi:hypothetical protein
VWICQDNTRGRPADGGKFGAALRVGVVRVDLLVLDLPRGRARRRGTPALVLAAEVGAAAEEEDDEAEACEDEGTLSFVTTMCSHDSASPYKLGWGSENDRRPSSKPAELRRRREGRAPGEQAAQQRRSGRGCGEKNV